MAGLLSDHLNRGTGLLSANLPRQDYAPLLAGVDQAIANSRSAAPAQRQDSRLGRALTFFMSGTNGLDRRDAARERERMRPQLEAQQARLAEIARGMGPTAEAAFALNPEGFGKALSSQYESKVVGAGAGLGSGAGGLSFEMPSYTESGDQIIRRSSQGVEPVFTRTAPSIAEQTNMDRVALDREQGQARLGLDYNKLAQDAEQFTMGQALEREKIGAAQQERAQSGETGLRKEFDSLPDVKAFRDVEAAYQTLQAVAQNPSPAGDISLLTGYMKMLDPGSTVREGEFATASNAGGVSDRIRNAYNQALRGTRLTDEQRRDFLGQAGNIYNTRRQRYEAAQRQYSELAGSYGADSRRVTGSVAGQPVRVNSVAEARALPSGTVFIDPNGVRRRVP